MSIELQQKVAPHANHETIFVAPNAGVLEGVDIFTTTSNVIRVTLNDVTIEAEPEQSHAIEKGDRVIVYFFNDSAEEDEVEVNIRYHEAHPTEVPQSHPPLTIDEVLGIIDAHPEREKLLEAVMEKAFAASGPSLPVL